MQIGLIGYGRMGREVERMALTRGHEIVHRFDVEEAGSKTLHSVDAQVLIDFSTAEAVLEHAEAAAAAGIPLVEGTTGWQDRRQEIEAIENLTMIYSANFSIGVYRFQQVVKLAGRLYGALGVYDTYVHEWHHTGKADSPSGTALSLAKSLLEELPDKRELLTTAAAGKIAPDRLHVSSTRVGRIPGTHEVGFDSPYDQITIRHQAFGREAFAFGAVRAAEWICGKHGLFTMDDFMADQ
jgi:4-hydroxy-tetrahydrodipicolinate reductase